MLELLTPVQMSEADQQTINSGIPGIDLMENAGKAVANVAMRQFPSREKVLVICGTGNNGGDGYVAARHLEKAGKEVRVFICGDITSIGGDAELALAEVNPSLILKEAPSPEDFDLIIDALLGAGLARDVSGKYAQVIKSLNSCGKPVLSIDLPSGINGATGAVHGSAVRAAATVTFFRLKPGHLLAPGCHYCGNISLEQIGVGSEVISDTGFAGLVNKPELWEEDFPSPSSDGHKYSRGHALVISGPATKTGAARLAAQAALRSGAGLVTLASPNQALLENACHLTSVMLVPANSAKQVKDILADDRINVVAAGPGMPPDSKTRTMVKALLSSNQAAVIDAGGLTAFGNKPEELFEAIDKSRSGCVLTPHEGEFHSLFPKLKKVSSKLERAVSAAKLSGATIVLKGPDTVVAGPNGRAAITETLPSWLATAGSGDVLTGIVAGMLAQGMDTFNAACAAVWIHGQAASLAGPGMISSDLDVHLRDVIKKMITKHSTSSY